MGSKVLITAGWYKSFIIPEAIFIDLPSPSPLFRLML